MKKKVNIQKIIYIGMMSALVFIATYIHFDIPTPLGKTMIHLGNVMCLLSGLLFGPFIGGLAAGIGSCLYDLFDPCFISEAWITFIMKFIMAFITGLIYKSNKFSNIKYKSIIATIIGATIYVIIYILKSSLISYFILSKKTSVIISIAITKGITSLINAIIAVIISVVLLKTLEPILTKSKTIK